MLGNKKILRGKWNFSGACRKRAGLNLAKLNLDLNGIEKLTLEEYALICGVLGVNTDFFLKPRLPDKEVK